MNGDTTKGLQSSAEWVTIDDAARMLNLTPNYASQAIRKGFLKGKISYRSYSGRNFLYSVADIEKLLEQATVPARPNETTHR